MKTLFLILSLMALSFGAQSAAIVGNRFDTNSDNVLVNGSTLTNLTLSSRIATVGAKAQYATIKAAATAANAGDTVLVWPGAYVENGWLKAGVNYHFFTGASISWTSTVQTLADGLGFIDDRGTGATTNRITGFGDFYFSCGTNFESVSGFFGNTNCAGLLVLTNLASDIVFQFHKCDGDSFACSPPSINGVQAYESVFYISRCRRCELQGREVLSSRGNDSPNGNASVWAGLYWELGETYFDVAHIGQFPLNYGIWLQEPAGAHTDNIWISSQLCEAYLYPTAHSSTYRSWYNFTELRVTNGYSVGQAGTFTGGSHYLQADKISALDANAGLAVLAIGGGAEVWVRAQKLTAASGVGEWVAVTGNSTAHLSVQHYHAVGTIAVAGFVTAGATSLLEVDGGEALLNGVGIEHDGGRAIFKNVGICTTNVNAAVNFPVKVTAAGLSLQNCRLIGPALCLTNIFSTSAQTVGIYNVASTVTNAAIITLSPNAGFTSDANVR